MSYCCDRACETRFCPECGSRVRRWDLASLASHIAARLKFQEGALGEAQAKLAKMDTDGWDQSDAKYRRLKVGMASRLRLVDCYKGWLAALQEVRT